MAWRAGDIVRRPDGHPAVVLGVDAESLVIVRLDGDATGAYPASSLRPADDSAPDEEES